MQNFFFNSYKYALPIFWAVKISIKTNPLLFCIIFCLNIFSNAISGIINSFLLAKITSSVAFLAIHHGSVKIAIVWVIIFGVFTALVYSARKLSSLFSIKFNNKFQITVDDMYIQKVSRLSQEQLDDPLNQQKLQTSRRELYSISRIANDYTEIIIELTGYMIAIIVLWHYAWGIALILLVIIPILVINNYYQVKRRRKSWEDSAMSSRIASSLFYYLTDPLRLFQIILLGARDNVRNLRIKFAKKSRKIEYESDKKNELFEFIDRIIEIILDVGTRIWAIILVAIGRLNFDQFIFVLGLIQNTSSQTWSFGYSSNNLQEAYLAARGFKEVMDLPVKNEGDLLLQDDILGVKIDIRNASLDYRGGTKALDNINMSINAGQKIAIVGENGSGKSSLLRLITGQYSATVGSVLLNDQLIEHYKFDNLFQNISILDQEYFLLEDLTIKQNLRIGTNKEVSTKEIYNRLEMVNLLNKIRDLKHGLNSRLDRSYDDGIDLSGGQKQRLAIARALIKNAKLLILDEPTSAIDAKAEKKIFDRIFMSHQNSTIIIVSHRFSTVRKADYIYVLDKGKIIEQGNHDKLMNNNGLYSELYNIQLEDLK